MNAPARQVWLVLMLLLGFGGCNGDVALVLGIEAGTDAPAVDAAADGSPPGDAPPDGVAMTSDAADTAPPLDVHMSVEVEPDGAPATDGGDQ